MKKFFQKIINIFRSLFPIAKRKPIEKGPTSELVNDNIIKALNEIDNSSKLTPKIRSNSKALMIIKKWEGLFLKAYKCPAGIPTIGWGTIKYPNGGKVQLGDKITENQASEYLSDEVARHCIPYIEKLVKVPLNENQRAALISFIYNLGATNFRDSTLLKRLNESNYDEAAKELLRWTYAGGKHLEGLLNRRKDEKKLFETPGELVNESEA